ncbi:hypothetical protein [Cetobacterium sp. ZOR0034]|uniref:hypothetical protein n=1 Tax=Cetobacterium sp. ZOR0034 TaxID=1339239 RepID=UPI000647382C|nr:hypothetical protein [Cetobacterium sp. ZOR0034]
MKNIKGFITLFCLLRVAVFSLPEEAYIEIDMRGHKNDFYRVLLDEDTQDLYIGIGDFIDFSRIPNLKLDRRRLRVKGDLDEELSIDVRIPKNSVIEMDNDIFIKLDDFKRYFHMISSDWDEERYVLKLNPDFKTQDEYVRELNAQRSLLGLAKREEEMIESGDYIQNKKKLLSPGLLKFVYVNEDFKENDYYIDIDYGTELLYGEFQISQRVYPESELDYIRLQYKEIFGEYYLTFGDFYLESDSMFDNERSLRGVSFSRNEYYGIRIDNRTIIEGLAYNANLVELYRNDRLEDFQMITGDSFSFRVRNSSSSDRYTIKIFYRDGREETKAIYILGNQTILEKGENDFVIQAGQGNNQKKEQYLAKYRYGVTKDLTATIGTSFLENRDSEKYEVLEGALAYRFGFDEYPTLISGTILDEMESGELNYKATLEQKLPSNINFYFGYENYGDRVAEKLNLKESYNVELSKSFRRLGGTIGYLKESYNSNNYDEYYLNLDYDLARSVRLSLNNEYYIRNFSDSQTNKLEGFGTEMRMTYSGFNGILAVLEGKVNYEDNEMVDDEIKLGVTKATSERGLLRNVDTTFEVGYSKEKGTFFELRFTYIFDKNIYIELPDIRREDGETKVGGRVEKTFYLGNPFLALNNNSVTDGWVEGKVFVDENINGILDENEEIYEGAEIMTSGGSGLTRENGNYIIGDISNTNIHTIEVNRETIDPMLVQGKEVIKFKGATSSRVNVDIPLVPVSMISGYVENSLLINERVYYSVLAGLDIVLKKNGEEVERTTPEIDGYYFFEDVLPGEYIIEIVPNSRRYIGTFDKKVINLKVKSGREGDYYEDNNFAIKSIELIEDEILD